MAIAMIGIAQIIDMRRERRTAASIRFLGPVVLIAIRLST
jgi:hypothetical protein